MMVLMIFMVPVAFMHLPALLVVVIMRMAVVGPLVWGALPDAIVPDVAPSIVAPVALGPDEANAWRGRTHFTAKGWWCAADVDVDLRNSGCSKRGDCESTYEEVQFQTRAFMQNSSPFLRFNLVDVSNSWMVIYFSS
jgi:hypothetical protein